MDRSYKGPTAQRATLGLGVVIAQRGRAGKRSPLAADIEYMAANRPLFEGRPAFQTRGVQRHIAPNGADLPERWCKLAIHDDLEGPCVSRRKA